MKKIFGHREIERSVELQGLRASKDYIRSGYTILRVRVINTSSRLHMQKSTTYLSHLRAINIHLSLIMALPIVKLHKELE